MTDHQLKESIKHFINSYTHQAYSRHIDKDVTETDLLWDSSRFWAHIIHKSVPMREKMTHKEFLDYKQQYEAQNNIIIDSDALFDRFWLRNILGFIEVPDGIRRLCYTFEEISKSKEELDFLDFLYYSLPKGSKKIAKIDIESKLSEYNTINNTTITADVICERFEIKNDTIELSNYEYYYAPFLTYWQDFQFLFSLDEQYRKEPKGLQISQSNFCSIHATFSQLYPYMPSIDSLLEQRVVSFESESNSYLINFYNTEIKYFDLSDKICGFFWELLSNDISFSNDKERILNYLSKILCWENSSEGLCYCSENAKKRFLDAAFQIVKEESDLDGVKNELKKVQVDSYHIHGIYEIVSDKIENNYPLRNSDLFELYESVYELEHNAHITFLHDQGSRNWIFYLLRIIVMFDFEVETDNIDDGDKTIYHYNRITQLLKGSKNKPSLLGQIVNTIAHRRRDIIPYLLTDIEFVSLCFQIIDEFQFLEDEQDTLRNKLWGKCLELGLMTIRSHFNDKIASILIFQIFRQINKHKYDNPNNRHSEIRDNNRERPLLDLIEKSTLNNRFYGFRTNDDYLFPHLFEDLTGLFVNFEEKNIYNNGVVKLPLLKLDGLAWLMRCSTYWRYKEQLGEFNVQGLSQEFYDIYIDCIEINNVERYNFGDKKLEMSIPIWAEKNERTSVVDWLYPVWFLYKNRLLNKFLEPEFIFENQDNYFNQQNHFTAEKLRSHIGILLQIHKKLVLPVIPHSLKKEILNKIRRRIEDKIISYIDDNSNNIPEEGKIDIFDYQQEWKFQSSGNEALLPQIAQAINYFNDKDGLIKIIISTNDIIKILTFAEYITSETIKQRLIDRVQQSDVSLFLKSSNWIPEIQTTLSKLIQYPELISQIEEAISFWEKEVTSKKNKKREYQKFLYQAKLLLAYFKEDEQSLNDISLPDDDGPTVIGEISDNESKIFYRALIRLKDNPSDSYKIFDSLSKMHPKYVNIALNRMAAKIKMADKDGNIDYYNEALEEWEEYVNVHGKDVDENKLGDTFIANKMLIYFKTQQYEMVNRIYSNLDMLSQMKPEILRMNIDAFVALGKSAEASILQKEAEAYHKATFSGDLEEVKKIKSPIKEGNIIEELKSHYHKIFSNNPDKLIKIFPENLNGKTIINEFVTKEIALAASKMLDKIMAIDKIEGENKYNDIIELVVDSRINPWGWNVGGQSRGGFSNPKDKGTPKEPGERDLPIMDINKSPFCICEAFVYRDKPQSIDHVQKIFNYYHQHKNLIILIYNLNHDNFENNWAEYITEIVPKASYPNDCDFKSINDATSLFEYENSAIKIAQSNHGKDITMHHIFVNIDYRNKR